MVRERRLFQIPEIGKIMVKSPIVPGDFPHQDYAELALQRNKSLLRQEYMGRFGLIAQFRVKKSTLTEKPALVIRLDMDPT